jgi:thymidylate synthase
MPWAEDHFKERICGTPLNPGEQYKNWPWYKHDNKWRDNDKFTHTYMERYWPKIITDKITPEGNHGRIMQGIRYPYGDLSDMGKLLQNDPYTRQAYLPVWFPEDTGVIHGGRVPCTIGYHFILRDNKLNIHYQIRACDALRHFRNDVYLTCRLLQWILEELKGGNSPKFDWSNVTPGILTMDIISFHVFKKEINLI